MGRFRPLSGPDFDAVELLDLATCRRFEHLSNTTAFAPESVGFLRLSTGRRVILALASVPRGGHLPQCLRMIARRCLMLPNWQ